MDITVGSIQPTKSDSDSLRVVPVAKSDRNRDRRKRKQDRRKNVRDGIFVSLSVKKDRRHPEDRRKAGD
jgi:hypothetical protein